MTATALPRARRQPDAVFEDACRRSGAVLLLTALSGPFWNVIVLPLPGVSLTVGRALIALGAITLVLDLRRAPRPLPRVQRAVWLLLGLLALLWIWTVANALVWGCRCAGEIAGLSELLALVALAAFAATFEPRLQPLLVLAIIAGAVLAALLTLAGVDGLSAARRIRRRTPAASPGPTETRTSSRSRSASRSPPASRHCGCGRAASAS